MSGAAALAIALLVASALFFAYPDLDLATARLFYDGITFPISGNPLVEALRNALIVAEDGAFVLVLGLSMANRKAPILNLGPRDWLFQTMIFVLGPGLIVNGILKRFWGRARPFQIEEFGGTASFTKAWAFADQCAANCSFVSGEMAGATALAISITLVVNANRHQLSPGFYRMVQALSGALPLVTAWQRMAAGRHFLSDVVISALLVGLLVALQHRLFYGKAQIKRC